jgi:hypothetical protein
MKLQINLFSWWDNVFINCSCVVLCVCDVGRYARFGRADPYAHNNKHMCAQTLSLNISLPLAQTNKNT